MNNKTQHWGATESTTYVRTPGPVIEFTGQEGVVTLFTRLTSYTCPYGYETEMYGDSLTKLGWEKDDFDNYRLLIPKRDGTLPETAFTAHMDTASYGIPTRVVHGYKEDGSIYNTASGILGADDKAGMTLLLIMAHQLFIPGYYFLFVGEERGCVGSHDAAAQGDWSHLKRMISFDRRNYWDVITNQAGTDCCSQAFAEALAKELNAYNENFKYKPDPTGAYTDSEAFIDLIPECTNISVGYFGAHGTNEEQDIMFLDLLVDALAEVDWESLPTVRDPKAEKAQRSTRWGAYSRNWGSYKRGSTSTRYTYGTRTSSYEDDDDAWLRDSEEASALSYNIENVDYENLQVTLKGGGTIHFGTEKSLGDYVIEAYRRKKESKVWYSGGKSYSHLKYEDQFDPPADVLGRLWSDDQLTSGAVQEFITLNPYYCSKLIRMAVTLHPELIWMAEGTTTNVLTTAEGTVTPESPSTAITKPLKEAEAGS